MATTGFQAKPFGRRSRQTQSQVYAARHIRVQHAQHVRKATRGKIITELIPTKYMTTKSATNTPNSSKGILRLRDEYWTLGRQTLLMGIVNVTPDSFSSDGRTQEKLAVDHALQQITEGAHIIDIGGESTRPGYTPVEVNDELHRVVPVIRELRARNPQIPISIDTTKPEVLERALDAGADVLNCVDGMPADLLSIATERQIPIVITHWQKTASDSGDMVDKVIEYLKRLAADAVEKGLRQEQVILDPGIGFGKNADDNISILHSLDRLTSLGFPTLLGTSRKSFIGKITGRTPQERVYGTAATVALGIAAGVDIVRVHDVACMADVVAVADAIVRKTLPPNWEMVQ